LHRQNRRAHNQERQNYAERQNDYFAHTQLGLRLLAKGRPKAAMIWELPSQKTLVLIWPVSQTQKGPAKKKANDCRVQDQ
jgi:hypothetical protein